MPKESLALAPVRLVDKPVAVQAVIRAVPLIVLIALIYRQVIYDLVLDWWTVPSLSQGLLIPPLVVWMAWGMRARVRAAAITPDARGLVLMAAACAILLFGQLAAEFFLSRISLVLLLAGITWTFWGFARLHALTFPFLLLATMVPLPALIYNRLAAPLQLFATAVSAKLAKLAGVTVHVDGNIIQLASTTLGVEEACSGLSALSALIVGSLLIGFIQCSGLTSRLILFLLAVPVAILTNIFRVTGTALLADYDADYALGYYHSFSGWLVFVVGFGMLYGASRLLHRVLEGRT
jgi:exosortase